MNNNLKKAAKEVFDANPTIGELHVSIDGQCFTTEHSAVEHTKGKLGKYPDADQMPVAFKREETKLDPVAEVIEKINQAASIDEVYEAAGDDTRKSVTQAIEKRIAALAEKKPPHSAAETID
jgi:hypothetical protein